MALCGRYRIREAGNEKQLALKGNMVRVLDVTESSPSGGGGGEVPWQLWPVIGKKGRFTLRTCWREDMGDRRVGCSVGVSNGSLQVRRHNCTALDVVCW